MAGSATRLKRLMPRSLFGRALMILVGPILLLQLVVTTAVADRFYEGVTTQMAGDAARELDFIVTAIDASPDDVAANDLLAVLERPLGISLTLDPEGEVEPQALRRFYDVTGSIVAETLKSGISRPLTLDLVSQRKMAVVRILTGHGILRAEIERSQLSPSNPHQLLVLTNIAATSLVIIAVMFLRNQVRPIRELASAAQAFGRGVRVAFRPSGAEEVRRAGHSFLDMRARIERQIQTRTAMLSGVSHDLRTPLTRMKLAVAMMPEEPETRDLAHDVGEMERMLDSFLAFARGEAGEAAVAVDATMLAREVAADAERLGTTIDQALQVDPAAEGETTMRRQAVKRAVTNLVDNALRYGQRARLTLRQTRRVVEFVVEDDGPGIPAARREEMLRPFTRLDEARGQDTGGVGLGLSIALDIARSHGGALVLDESAALGGLRAVLRLPRGGDPGSAGGGGEQPESASQDRAPDNRPAASVPVEGRV
ncbi:MAG: ATP-binding protein [Pseudomonadota bacterium]